MPPRRPKETLEEVRQRLTREQQQRTTTRIGELAVQTQQNTHRQRLSDLACENYLTAARNRREQEQALREASAQPAAYDSTFLVLVCLLLWVLVANALLVQHIYINRREVKQERGKGRGYPEYQRKYKQQLECIIRGMFSEEPAGAETPPLGS
jgi:hypothetical protein